MRESVCVCVGMRIGQAHFGVIEEIGWCFFKTEVMFQNKITSFSYE